MDLGIAGRSALVMGASRGLGRAIAEALGAEGTNLALCARDTPRLAEAARAVGGLAIPADLSRAGEAADAVRRTREALGGPDILVVNSGGPPPGQFDTLSDEQWREAFESLWISCVQAIREALPSMKERRWGRILVVTSIASREPISNLMLSNGLRAGLHGLLNALSKEVAADGVTVNALMPGYTLTERLIEVGIDEAQTAARIPARRMGRPEEFAALAAFLASDIASYITGQAIACDGGVLNSI